ncbi:MAG: ComEC/Rec2 family competence protein, partial [Chitinivibrionales bacterium]|nr:ComEC/Rec2 family competence protein [Chitinivibrionales bacterium]
MNIHSYLMSLFPETKKWLAMPAVSAFIGLCCGIIAASVLWRSFPVLIAPTRGLICIVTALVGGILTRSTLLRTTIFLFCGVILFYRDSTLFESQLKACSRCFQHWPILIHARVVSSATPQGNHYSFYVKTAQITAGDDSLTTPIILLCRASVAPPREAVIHGYATVSLPQPPVAPFTYNPQAQHQSYNGWIDTIISCDTSHTISTKILGSVRKNFQATADHITAVPIRNLLLALFLGQRTTLPLWLNQAFANAGIAHLLAISGTNIGILCGTLLFLFSFLPLPYILRLFITLSIIWGYYFLVGPLPSLFRAALMATIVTVSLLRQKNAYGLNSLAIAGIIWLLYAPASLMTAPFQLSFAATAGIIILLPRLRISLPETRLPSFIKKIATTTMTTLSITVAAFIATLAPLLHFFNTIPLYGLIANCIAVPITGLSMVLFLIAFIFHIIMHPLCSYVLVLVTLCAKIVCFTAQLSFSIPWATIAPAPLPPIIFIFYNLAICAYAAVDRIYVRQCLQWSGAAFFFCLPLCFLFTLMQQKVNVFCFSSHKNGGSYALIHFPNNAAWIIETSPSEAAFSGDFRRTIAAWIQRTCPQASVSLLTANL